MSGDDLPAETFRRAGGDDNDPNGEPRTQDYDEDEDGDELEYGYWGRSHARTPKWFPPITTPQEAGLKLLMGGEFGRVGIEARSCKGSTDVSRVILSRRSRLRPTPKQDITNVRAVCSVRISLDHENRQSYRTPVVQLSRL
jgi:WD repeat-containing protein 23